MTDSSQTRLIGTTTHSHGVSKHGSLRTASAVHQGVGKAAPEKGHRWTWRAAGCGQVDPALTPCCFSSTCQTRAALNNTPLHKETVTPHRRWGVESSAGRAAGSLPSRAALWDGSGSATSRSRLSPPGATNSSAVTSRIQLWETRGRSSPGEQGAALRWERGGEQRATSCRADLRPRGAGSVPARRRCPQSVSRWEGASPALTHGDGGCGDIGGQEAEPGRASEAAPSGRPARSPGPADRCRPAPARRRLSRRVGRVPTRRAPLAPGVNCSPCATPGRAPHRTGRARFLHAARPGAGGHAGSPRCPRVTPAPLRCSPVPFTSLTQALPEADGTAIPKRLRTALWHCHPKS